MEFKIKCEICKEEYDNYMRTLYIEKGNERACVCNSCKNKELEKERFVYWDDIPTFVDGADIIYRVFKNEEELQNYILQKYEDGNRIITQSQNTIVTVDKYKRYWWVQGYVSCKLNFPYFNEVVNRYDENGILTI